MKLQSQAAVLAREVREKVGRIIGGTEASPELQALGRAIPIHDVLSDVHYFQQQAANHASQIAVYLNDHDPIENKLREIPVVAKFPDLHNLRYSIDVLSSSIGQSKLKAEQVSARQGREIFADRLADFIVSRATAHGHSAAANIVIDSNRTGDIVLYAMGYFYSTGTACGTSTPAIVQLLSGRYSFGIVNASIHDFDGTIWAIPTADGHVRLNKP
jgi:hypothetical protein